MKSSIGTPQGGGLRAHIGAVHAPCLPRARHETVTGAANVERYTRARRATVLDPKWDERGLIQTVTTDAATGDGADGRAHERRRARRDAGDRRGALLEPQSRQEVWHKGATSGNTQAVVELRIDCDQDAVWLRVTPAGPACHTGERSCFYRAVAGRVVAR